MTTASMGRPQELHINTVDTVDLDAMPLITSMAYGERHVSEAVNRATSFIVSPGIYKGYNIEPNGGLEILITRDGDSGYSVGVVEIGHIQLRVFQQHDIKLTMIPNELNYIVLEGFYEHGTETSQVTASSTTPPARIRRVTDDLVAKEHVILCTVDLTSNPSEIEEWMIDYALRTTCDLNVAQHIAQPNPHPQYNSFQKAHFVSGEDVLDIENLNVVVDTLHTKLRAYQDGTMINIELLSTIDCYDGTTTIEAPDGEEIFWKGGSSTMVTLHVTRATLFRYKGSWYVQ